MPTWIVCVLVLADSGYLRRALGSRDSGSRKGWDLGSAVRSQAGTEEVTLREAGRTIPVREVEDNTEFTADQIKGA